MHRLARDGRWVKDDICYRCLKARILLSALHCDSPLCVYPYEQELDDRDRVLSREHEHHWRVVTPVELDVNTRLNESKFLLVPTPSTPTFFGETDHWSRIVQYRSNWRLWVWSKPTSRPSYPDYRPPPLPRPPHSGPYDTCNKDTGVDEDNADGTKWFPRPPPDNPPLAPSDARDEDEVYEDGEDVWCNVNWGEFRI